MKKLIGALLLWGAFLGSYAQSESTANTCEQKTERAKKLLTGSGLIVKNVPEALDILKKCADSGNAEAQYTLGYFYKRRSSRSKSNQEKAFKYIQLSANQDHPKGVCELGVLYKYGIGCNLDFDESIKWFEKAEELGNGKGSYSIGYMYLKGLGTISQDYDKAIEWFTISDYPMAKHWLAICNYFGYGVPLNKDIALELFLSNSTKNSQNFLKFIESHADIVNLGVQKENTIKASEFNASKINEVITADTEGEITEDIERLEAKDILGEWKGKIIELDWAGELMIRSFPVTLKFDATSDNTLNYKINLKGTESRGLGVFLDNNFYFNDCNVSIPRMLVDNRKFNLNYKVLSVDNIEVKKLNSVNYLITDISAQETDFKEPAKPMVMVLNNTKLTTANGTKINQDVLEALLASKNDTNFITTYPNPFESDLLIQYDLEEQSNTSVEMYSLDGLFTQTIVSGEQQSAGNHIYHIDGSSFKAGLYVIRVTANNVVNTKLIIKE